MKLNLDNCIKAYCSRQGSEANYALKKSRTTVDVESATTPPQNSIMRIFDYNCHRQASFIY